MLVRGLLDSRNLCWLKEACREGLRSLHRWVIPGMQPPTAARPSPAPSLLVPPRAGSSLPSPRCTSSGSFQHEGFGPQHCKGSLLCSRMTKFCVHVHYLGAQLTGTSHFSDTRSRSDETQIKTQNNLNTVQSCCYAQVLSKVPYLHKTLHKDLPLSKYLPIVTTNHNFEMELNQAFT